MVKKRGNVPTFSRKILTWFVYAIAISVSFVVLLGVFVWIGMFGKLPDKDDLKKIQHPIASEVYSADSVLLGRYYLQDRSPVGAKEIPKSLKEALIATEDVRFYKHSGVDVKSLFRVFFKTILLQDEGSGGGSTLTQQLAKNLYPRRHYVLFSMPINKIKEFIVASRLEDTYSKDEILVLYLNTIPFADNTYGVKTAAFRFFSKQVPDLSVDESAVLVGMLKATHYYNPRLFPDRSLKRRNIVLSQMEKYHYLSSSEKTAFQSKQLGLHYNNTTYNAGLAPYFRSYIKTQLLTWCKEHSRPDGNPYNLYTDGLRIFTSIDSRMQQYAEEGMRSQMQSLQERFERQLTKSKLNSLAKEKLKQLPIYAALKNEGLKDAEIVNRLSKPAKTKIFNWNGKEDAEVSVLDSLKHHLKFLQAGILAVEPQTGYVKVWVGGIDFRYFQYDHVKESTKRQVGSTIKPLIYAAAIESGVSPCDYISARKTSYTNMEGWTPENTNEETYEKKYSMEGGLAGSVNTVSVKILEKTGITNAISSVRKMGITSKLPAVPSLALGTPSISVMEMVNAYAVLANHGVYRSPSYLISICDQHGEPVEIFKHDQQGHRALSRESSDLMVHMMKTVVSEGTGSALKSKYGITNDVAGKTGTTQSNVDGWFIAVMPKLVIGAWVGADDPRMHFSSTSLGQGSVTALPIVGKFLVKANQDADLKTVMWKRFDPLPDQLLAQLDCKPSKSNKNLFERIFQPKKKKRVKITKFKSRKGRNS